MSTDIKIKPDLSGYVPITRQINTNSPLYGGGDLSADRTLSIYQANGSTNGYLSSADWTTFNNKQNTISLTTTGSSGSATFIANTLNIPSYSLSGLGGVPTTRNLTINGTTYDLSTDRTWNVGTVTSVAALTLGTTGTDLSSTVANGTTTPTITLNVPTASATNRGALSSTDWNTFNNKLSAAVTSINSLTGSSQTIATGTTGTDFGVSSSGSTHTLNLPTASATNTGKLSSTDWSTFNGKQNAITLTTTGTSGAATLVGATLNIPQYAGGLTYFTEAQNTSAPNATTPVDSLTAVSAATNADFAIIPKGNGAILADIPDGVVTGGNKRGTGAVDLQMNRLTNAAVASGVNSVISGGNYNTSSGQESSVGGGYQNTASGTQSRIGGGSQNNATSDFATVGGGVGNTASGSRTTVAGGSSCTATNYGASTLGGFGNTSTNNYASNIGGNSNSASGDTSTVLGGASNTSSGSYSISGGASSVANSIFGVALGWGATTNSVIYRQVYGVRHTSNGDAQSSTFIMRMRTTDGTLTTFTSDGTTAASNNQVILSNNSAFRFKGTIIAKQSGSTNTAAWDIDGLIVRGANAAATTLNIGNVTLVQNTPGWGTPTLAADTTQGVLRIQIQGAAATNIQWVGDIKTTEVIY